MNLSKHQSVAKHWVYFIDTDGADPVWNENFTFEVADDADLQNEPLELKVMVSYLLNSGLRSNNI